MLTMVSLFRNFYILSLPTTTLFFELFKTLRVIENGLLVIENGQFEISGKSTFGIVMAHRWASKLEFMFLVMSEQNSWKTVNFKMTILDH